MKFISKYVVALTALCLLPLGSIAQSLTLDANTAPRVLPARDTVTLAYDNDITTVAIKGNTSYTATADADWVTCKKLANGNLSIMAAYYYDAANTRTATVTLTPTDGSDAKTICVKQTPNNSAASLEGDEQITISSATASQTESGYAISKTYDGNTSTYWHSPWSSSSTSFPITLTYTLKQATHVDYLVYTPRQDGNSNGNFGQIKIEYQTSTTSEANKKDAPSLKATTSTWVTLTETDLGGSSSASTVNFGENGVDDVSRVRITVQSGQNNFASCAEMAFYQRNNELNTLLSTYFEDDLCTTLKSGVTTADLPNITNAYVRQLVSNMLQGDYSTEFRVGEFDCYLTRSTLQSTYKTSCGYDPYENPTGIYFEKGDNIVVFAEGINSSYPVQLSIKCFSNADNISTEGQPESTYSLINGVNVITAQNRGNGYVLYYSDDYENAPTVKLHFAMATESGYFDPRKHTNADYKRLLAAAKSDIFDFYTQRAHVAVPVANLRKVCPENAEKLALIYDSVMYREREIMGLPQLNKEMKNHQFAQPVASGMYANSVGANAAFGSFNEWCNPEDFGFWGFGHELGHNNQITPGFKWGGLGETTNNIYSSWVEHKVGAKGAYGDGYHRLEDETSGIDTYSSTRGGRFEAYLEEGVRKGVSWQLQDGPDYHGTTASSTTVTGQDADGNSTGTVTTTSRNYDHFLKVVPLWQLSLYTEEVGAAPTTWGKVIETYRTDFSSTTYNTSGKQQIEFMRRFCEQSGINFLPFFEKAGLLKTINAYIEDYSPAWLIINESMISALKTDIEAKGYPECPAALNYINAYNWQRFRDKVALTEGTLGQGCTLSGTRVKVDNNVWTGAVGYETYDESGNLLHISMFGLGDSQMSSRYTYVLFPSTASYIMAVGYDGTAVKIYER